MNGPLLIIIAFTVIFAFYAKQIFKLLKERKRLAMHMSKIPGVTGLPIIGSAWMFKPSVPDATEQFLYWCLYFYRQGVPAGKLWIGTNPTIIPVEPKLLKMVLQSNDLITKANLYDSLHPWLGTGLLTSTGQKWADRRKLITPSFHFNVLNSFISIHDYQAKIFLEQLEPFSISKKEFDIFPYIKRMALDIICETSMGTTVDAQHNHNHSYVNSIKRLNELILKFNMYPFLKNKILRKLSGFGDEYDHLVSVVTDFTRKVIDEKWQEYTAYETGARIEDKNRKKAFLDMLMDVRHEGNMSYEDVREEVDTFMFEGHDTTSSSMGWVLWSLACHPQYQEKVIEEVDKIFGGTDRDCTNDDLKELKYLEKCIKEGLRLFPAVPLYARQIEEDFEFEGITFPKDAILLILPYALHRIPDFYKDSLNYDPEHFSDEAIASRHAFADVPFSAGPRNCIGQKFALMEEKTALSWFFRRYRIRTNYKWRDNRPAIDTILKPSLGFPVIIEKRHPKL